MLSIYCCSSLLLYVFFRICFGDWAEDLLMLYEGVEKGGLVSGY